MLPHQFHVGTRRRTAFGTSDCVDVEKLLANVSLDLGPDVSPEFRERFLEQVRESYAGCRLPPVDHKVGAPVIDIHSVTVYSNGSITDEDRGFLVYGSIHVTDGRGHVLNLYDQPIDDPDNTNVGEALYLIDRDPIQFPFPITRIEFDLKDKIRDVQVACGTLTLDYTQEKILSLEKTEHRCVLGTHGFVEVSYTTFEAAVLASLSFKLCKQPHHLGGDTESESGCRDFCAEISASYESDYSFCRLEPATLISAGPDDPLRLKCGDFIPLAKSILAVPVYSSLRVQVDLKGVVSCHEIFPARRVGGALHHWGGSDDGYLVEALLDWRPGYPIIREIDQSSRTCLESAAADYRSSPQKTIWVPPVGKFRPRRLMEVFSIVVLPDEKLNQGGVVNIYGEIFGRCDMGGEEFILFERDASRPESAPCGDKGLTLTIEGPCKDYFEKAKLGLVVDLWDAAAQEPRLFCYGVLSWNDRSLSNPYESYWYDRPLCSLLQGERGLVKVHYSIFERAQPCVLNVSFQFMPTGPIPFTHVWGTIVARYGIFDYSSAYEKECHRSLLFSKSEESPFKLSLTPTSEWQIDLPLLKSVIAVPEGCSIVIEVDLFTRSSSGVQAAKHVGEFRRGPTCSWASSFRIMPDVVAKVSAKFSGASTW